MTTLGNFFYFTLSYSSLSSFSTTIENWVFCVASSGGEFSLHAEKMLIHCAIWAVCMQDAGIFECLQIECAWDAMRRANEKQYAQRKFILNSVFTYHDGDAAMAIPMWLPGTKSAAFSLITFFFFFFFIAHPFDSGSNKCMHITFITRSFILSYVKYSAEWIRIFMQSNKTLHCRSTLAKNKKRCHFHALANNLYGYEKRRQQKA